MSLKPTFALPLLFLAPACIVSNPYEGGDTFETLTTTQGNSSETGGESSTSGSGDGDGDPATTTSTTTGDGDGDPTTTDPTTTTTGDGDGDPTTTGDGDGDPPPVCERRRWRYDFDADSWSSVALDSVWAGANAPPCDVEILATSYVESSDHLLVWAANGMYYRQTNNNWATPEPIGDSFPQLANKAIESAIYVPPINGDDAQVVINSLPNAYFYYVAPNGAISHFDTLVIQDEAPPGPEQTQLTRSWSLSYGDPDLLGQLEWWNMWARFEDGKIYFADGGFNWDNWNEGASPMFNGNDAPDSSMGEAAWGTYDPNYAYLIGF